MLGVQIVERGRIIHEGKNNLTRSPPDRRALLSERLEQAKVTSAQPRKTFRFFFPPDQSLSVYCFGL